MEDPGRDEIETLKARWQKLLLGHRRQLKLIQMLEEVEEYLEKTVEQDLYQQLKIKKHELDHLLDEVEEIGADDVEEAQEALLARVLEYRPHLAQAYEMLQQKASLALEREHAYAKHLRGLEELETCLEAIVGLRNKVRGFGSLRYLLGQSPVTRITKAIERLQRQTASMLTDEQDEELRLLLQQLAGLTRDRWSYTLIDKHYAPLKESVTRLREQYHHALQIARKEKLTLADHISEWINQL